MIQDSKLGEEEKEEEGRVAAKYTRKGGSGKGGIRDMGPTDTAGVHSNRRQRALAITGVPLGRRRRRAPRLKSLPYPLTCTAKSTSVLG